MQQPSGQKQLALQTLLVKRLFAMADIDVADDLAAAASELIKRLQQAQQARGLIEVTQVASVIGYPLSALQARFPQLINDASIDDNPSAPIVMFSPFVAFRRVYVQYAQVASELAQRQRFSPPTTETLATIRWQFASNGGQLNEAQKLAAFAAASLPFCVITGGAGTGKTTTLTKALELILLDNPDADILLAAPTGKAAQRLNESLGAQCDSVHASVYHALTRLHAVTLHRLLGISENSGRAYRHAGNPLPCQVLAIDESSMMSSEIFLQVLLCLPPDAKLILLGDANQLPPIHSLSLFNEISQQPSVFTRAFIDAASKYLALATPLVASSANEPLANHVCKLTKAHRFAEQSTIDCSAGAVLSHDVATLLTALGKHWAPIPETMAFYQLLADLYTQHDQDMRQQLATHKILCANRHGELGSEAINHYLDGVFRVKLGRVNQTWYEGRQIIIEKNHADLQLSNGDIGHCTAIDGRWMVAFEEETDKRLLAIDTLPNTYSLAFAVTIHRSQGSEYNHVTVVLDRYDSEAPNPLVSPSLIYTAITRSKQTVQLFSDEALLRFALTTQASSHQYNAVLPALMKGQSGEK